MLNLKADDEHDCTFDVLRNAISPMLEQDTILRYTATHRVSDGTTPTCSVTQAKSTFYWAFIQLGF